MKVREVLSREHAMFRRLLDTIESDVSEPEDRSRAEIRRDLQALLPTLDGHQELERLVFEESRASADQEDALDRIRAQRRALEALRDETLYALELDEDCPIERMRSLSRFLILNLRLQLETEERRVWPRFADALECRAGASVPLSRRARVLETFLLKGLTAARQPGRAESSEESAQRRAYC